MHAVFGNIYICLVFGHIYKMKVRWSKEFTNIKQINFCKTYWVCIYYPGFEQWHLTTFLSARNFVKWKKEMFFRIFISRRRLYNNVWRHNWYKNVCDVTLSFALWRHHISLTKKLNGTMIVTSHLVFLTVRWAYNRLTEKFIGKTS